jgi:hypothetical protein
MASRLDLQDLLQTLIGVRIDEEPNVYFQPPSTVKMNYPCIVYSRNSANTQFANDSPYLHKIRYQILVIDKNPDSIIPEKVAMLPMCLFDRHYTADNLNHDAYNLYY